MPGPVAHLLKQRTAHLHQRVESTVGIADDLSATRLQAVLGRFAGFWRANERPIDEWAVRDRDVAARLQWARRRRGEALRLDLLQLGLSVAGIAELPEPPAVFDEVDRYDVLGWLYVSEGSTLGGAVIDRVLRSRPATAALRMRTFTPYLEGPGPMWRAYLAVLDELAGADGAHTERALAAAEGTFRALNAWLAPIGAERAA